MNYGDMQAQFTGLMNRRDLTPTLTLAFLQQSILRIQRTLRIPAMEKSLTATIGNLYTNGLTVPGDLLQFIAMTDETDPANKVELQRVALPEVLRVLNDGMINSPGVGNPCSIFARRASKFVIAPLPVTGSVLRMDYYATFGTLSASTDTNVLGDVAPDLIVYGGLSYAATYFLDKRQASFEQRYTQIYEDLMAQANQDELTGNACIAPAYHFPD